MVEVATVENIQGIQKLQKFPENLLLNQIKQGRVMIINR